MNKSVALMKWGSVILIVLLSSIFFSYQMGESITEFLFRNNVEKYLGEIEFLESKSDLSSKGSYFRVKRYPHTIYSYTHADAVLYHDTVNSIRINELYYEEMKEILERYFDDQEVVFHFNCNLSYSDESQRNQSILDISKTHVEQICMSDPKEAMFSISVTAVFPSEACIDLEEASRDLFILLNDEYEEMNPKVSVHVASANDIYFFEDQRLYEYFSYADKRLTSQNACSHGKLYWLFWNDTCNTVSKKQPEGIMKQLVKKYEEFYGYRFNVVDYLCTEQNDKAVCSYVIERVKNELTYEGVLEYEDCGSIKNHIETNQEMFKEQMKMKNQ